MVFGQEQQPTTCVRRACTLSIAAHRLSVCPTHDHSRTEDDASRLMSTLPTPPPVLHPATISHLPSLRHVRPRTSTHVVAEYARPPPVPHSARRHTGPSLLNLDSVLVAKLRLLPFPSPPYFPRVSPTYSADPGTHV